MSTFEIIRVDSPEPNAVVGVPLRDLHKVEQARVDLIESFTEGLEGLELTAMMCKL